MPSLLVVDTNFILDHLDLLKQLVDLGPKYQHTVVIPSEVTRELDGLKSSGRPVAIKAREVNSWLFTVLGQSHPGIRGQQLLESINPSLWNDDAILDCCLYFKKEYWHSLVILFSNDKNLCVKALSNKLLTVTYQKGLTATEIADKVASEAYAQARGVPGPVADVQDVDMPDVAMGMEDEIEAVEGEAATETPVPRVTKPMVTKPRVPGLRSPEPRVPARSVAEPTTPEPREPDPPVQMPSPLVPPESAFKPGPDLEKVLARELIDNIHALTLYRMRQAWEPEDYAYFMPVEPIASPNSLATVYRNHSIALFTDFFNFSQSKAFKYRMYPDSSARKVKWSWFFEFWGEVCIALAGNDPRYRKLVHDINEAYTKHTESLPQLPKPSPRSPVRSPTRSPQSPVRSPARDSAPQARRYDWPSIEERKRGDWEE